MLDHYAIHDFIISNNKKRKILIINCFTVVLRHHYVINIPSLLFVILLYRTALEKNPYPWVRFVFQINTSWIGCWWQVFLQYTDSANKSQPIANVILKPSPLNFFHVWHFHWVKNWYEFFLLLLFAYLFYKRWASIFFYHPLPCWYDFSLGRAKMDRRGTTEVNFQGYFIFPWYMYMYDK